MLSTQLADLKAYMLENLGAVIEDVAVIEEVLHQAGREPCPHAATVHFPLR